MNLDDLIIAWFCLLDDLVPTLTEGDRLRQRGPAPTLADSEVITMEVIGMYLGLNQDKALFAYFRRHWAAFFPGLAHLHRTTFVRQATNLWKVKEQLWCAIRDALLSYDPTVGIIDSFPLPVCQFARAYRCRRFRGEASYGKDTLIRQTFYGFRLHARICWPGVITRIELVPANVHEGEAALDLTPGTTGLLLGDRNYWLPKLKALLRQAGILLLTPFRTAKHAPPGSWSPVLGRIRYRIDTVFGQVVDRCQAKRVWARDRWHLCNRLLRMVLMHTLAVLFNLELGNPPLQLARLGA
ncbi:MAG TPA: IS982 family transposase [Ktedonobacterales bacterium]|jgi:hypothetical protein